MTARGKGKKRIRVSGARRFFLFLLTAAVLFSIGTYAVRSLWSQRFPPPQPTEYQIAYNRTECRRSADDIHYIVIHDTANKARSADAAHHYRYFNSGNHGASADFFVDDHSILRVNDYYTYYTWHCGDGNGANGITNLNSIGVEICINRGGNYRRTLSNTKELVRSLMAELHIDAEHVVRHYDASGKLCPGKMKENDWKAWEDFKEELK